MQSGANGSVGGLAVAPVNGGTVLASLRVRIEIDEAGDAAAELLARLAVDVLSGADCVPDAFTCTTTRLPTGTTKLLVGTTAVSADEANR